MKLSMSCLDVFKRIATSWLRPAICWSSINWKIICWTENSLCIISKKIWQRGIINCETNSGIVFAVKTMENGRSFRKENSKNVAGGEMLISETWANWWNILSSSLFRRSSYHFLRPLRFSSFNCRRRFKDLKWNSLQSIKLNHKDFSDANEFITSHLLPAGIPVTSTASICIVQPQADWSISIRKMLVE